MLFTQQVTTVSQQRLSVIQDHFQRNCVPTPLNVPVCQQFDNAGLQLGLPQHLSLPIFLPHCLCFSGWVKADMAPVGQSADSTGWRDKFASTRLSSSSLMELQQLIFSLPARDKCQGGIAIVDFRVKHACQRFGAAGRGR